LKGRVIRGSLSRRPSEAPKSNHTPLHGIAIKAQSAAMKKTLLVFHLDQPQQREKGSPQRLGFLFALIEDRS
jgi:hypothetical protein